MSLGPVNLSPIISGYVADKYGWRTNFWIMTAFTAVALLMIFFAAPETSYKRPALYETDILSTTDSPLTKEDLTANVIVPARNTGSDVSTPPTDEEKSPIEMQHDNSPRSYAQELLPMRGYETKDKPLVLLARLFTCALYPAVIWSFLVGGTYVAWVSLQLLPPVIFIR